MATTLNPPAGGLSRNQRIRASRLFDEIFALRQRKQGRYLALWLKRGPGTCRRLGVVAGRRIGGAVQRNRAKRRLREMFRSKRCLLQKNIDLVLVAKTGITKATWQEINEEFSRLACQLSLLDAENTGEQQAKCPSY